MTPIKPCKTHICGFLPTNDLNGANVVQAITLIYLGSVYTSI